MGGALFYMDSYPSKALWLSGSGESWGWMSLSILCRSQAFRGYVIKKNRKENPKQKLQEYSAHISFPRHTRHPKDGTEHRHHSDAETKCICLAITPPTSLYMLQLPFAWLYINYSVGFNSYKREYNPTFCYKRSYSFIHVPSSRERNQTVAPPWINLYAPVSQH